MQQQEAIQMVQAMEILVRIKTTLSKATELVGPVCQRQAFMLAQLFRSHCSTDMVNNLA